MKNAKTKSKIYYFLFIILPSILFSQSFQKLKIDTANYISKKIDLNGDGKKDYVFYQKSLKGSLMYFYVYKKNEYKLALCCANFSNDGMYKLVEIKQSKNKKYIIEISTIYTDKENPKATYYIMYKNKTWYLDKIIYEYNIWENNKGVTYICTYKENKKLNKNINYHSMNYKDKTCNKYDDK